MDLEEALKQFDIVDSNLTKLEAVWKKMSSLIPSGIAFVGESPEGREYRQLIRDYENLLLGLPSIDGWSLQEVPLELDEIAQNRLDANEVNMFEVQVSVEKEIDAPGRDIDEYRARMSKKRRELVRARLEELSIFIDSYLAHLIQENKDSDSRGELKESSSWEKLKQSFSEVDRLIGSGPRGKHWHGVRRHLNFGQVCDLHDIYEYDWPEIKAELKQLAYNQSEPIPVGVKDLGALVATRPQGSVSTALKWGNLTEESFERLIFDIISSAEGYENSEWLMKTNAADSGRDLSSYRVRFDSLSGTNRERVVVQCKHWLSRSIKDTDITSLLTKITHWEPPLFDILIVATSGRFTQDAVKYVEAHNHSGKRPKIEMWAESHLERLLAQRPHLAAVFKLR